ncbi:MAG: hypothetical protein ABIQ88_20385 [Chitinophagaceae bacterium]
MLDKHVFNERLKRLEPVDRKCYYCAEQDCQDMNDCYFVPLFKEQDRTNIVVYRSVKFKKIMVGIPRCKICLAIHQALGNKAIFYAIGLAAGIALMGFLIFDLFGIIMSVMAGTITGLVACKPIVNKLIDKAGILNLEEGAQTNETVQSFVIAGWSFSQPAA